MNITDNEFQKLASFVKEKTGVNLKENKKALVVMRLSKRLDILNFNNFEAYYQYLLNDSDGKELHYFVYNITTHYTFFLREKEQFKLLEEVVLPTIVPTINDGDLRIWSAATSTGEEAYTLAMIIDEYFGFQKKYWNKELLATDIAREVIIKAQLGVYDESELKDVPKGWRVKYFTALKNNKYQVKKVLRDEITFRSFNLLEPVFPFKKKFHVIFCRNVLIYFDSKTKFEVIEKLKDNLVVGGYLILGLSEAINYIENGLTYVQPSVYRKDK
jgi:chemotaxis protein methyltransferase CheR